MSLRKQLLKAESDIKKQDTILAVQQFISYPTPDVSNKKAVELYSSSVRSIKREL